MKNVFLILIIVIVGCNQKDQCDSWSTVADLDNSDLVKCKADSMYYYMKKFSGGMDSLRMERGIPGLPKDFQGVVWTVNNQVRWTNRAVIDKIYADNNFRESYMERKDIEWDKNILKYDRTNFSSMDSLESYLNVEYFLDTMVAPDVYRFNYWYSNKNMQPDKDSSVTKQQADSILKAWKIDY